MRDRPDYMPPIRLGEQKWSENPRSVFWRLLIGPPVSVAAVIFAVVISASAWLLILFVIVLIVESVQAVIYIPRARRAMAEEQVPGHR